MSDPVNSNGTRSQLETSFRLRSGRDSKPSDKKPKVSSEKTGSTNPDLYSSSTYRDQTKPSNRRPISDERARVLASYHEIAFDDLLEDDLQDGQSPENDAPKVKQAKLASNHPDSSKQNQAVEVNDQNSFFTGVEILSEGDAEFFDENPDGEIDPENPIAPRPYDPKEAPPDLTSRYYKPASYEKVSPGYFWNPHWQGGKEGWGSGEGHIGFRAYGGVQYLDSVLMNQLTKSPNGGIPLFEPGGSGSPEQSALGQAPQPFLGPNGMPVAVSPVTPTLGDDIRYEFGLDFHGQFRFDAPIAHAEKVWFIGDHLRDILSGTWVLDGSVYYQNQDDQSYLNPTSVNDFSVNFNDGDPQLNLDLDSDGSRIDWALKLQYITRDGMFRIPWVADKMMKEWGTDFANYTDGQASLKSLIAPHWVGIGRVQKRGESIRIRDFERDPAEYEYGFTFFNREGLFNRGHVFVDFAWEKDTTVFRFDEGKTFRAGWFISGKELYHHTNSKRMENSLATNLVLSDRGRPLNSGADIWLDKSKLSISYVHSEYDGSHNYVLGPDVSNGAGDDISADFDGIQFSWSHSFNEDPFGTGDSSFSNRFWRNMDLRLWGEYGELSLSGLDQAIPVSVQGAGTASDNNTYFDAEAPEAMLVNSLIGGLANSSAEIGSAARHDFSGPQWGMGIDVSKKMRISQGAQKPVYFTITPSWMYRDNPLYAGHYLGIELGLEFGNPFFD